MQKRNNLFSNIGIIVVISLLVIFGPLVLSWILKWILETIFLLDCHTTSGGSLPLPKTFCGNAMFIPLAVYYVWFVAPVPLVIPAIVIFFISRYYIKKNASN